MPKKKKARQKTTKCRNKYAEYKEIDITPLFDTPRGPREEPEKESSTIQRNLNDKNSKKLFYRKALNNFGPDDFFLTLEYKDKYLPTDAAGGNRELTNFFRRAQDLIKKEKLPPLRYMAVTECTLRQSGRHKGKYHIHHHLLISGELGRERLENLWRRPPRKGELEGDLIGFPSSKQLMFDENGIEGLMVYFFGEEKADAQLEIGVERAKYKRRWRGSKNLKDPAPPKKNDTKWSDKQVEKVALEMKEAGKPDPTFWEKTYPGYRFSKCTAEYNEVTCRWSLYVRMHRRL